MSYSSHAFLLRPPRSGSRETLRAPKRLIIVFDFAAQKHTRRTIIIVPVYRVLCHNNRTSIVTRLCDPEFS